MSEFNKSNLLLEYINGIWLFWPIFIVFLALSIILIVLIVIGIFTGKYNKIKIGIGLLIIVYSSYAISGIVFFVRYLSK